MNYVHLLENGVEIETLPLSDDLSKVVGMTLDNSPSDLLPLLADWVRECDDQGTMHTIQFTIGAEE